MAKARFRSFDRNRLVGLALMLAGALSVALITTCARFAYEGEASPMTLVWMRIVGVLGMVGTLQMVRRKTLMLPLPIIKKSAVMAVAMLLMSIGYLSSVAYINVSLAVILLYTFPMLVGLAAPIFGKERMTLTKAACLAGTFVGLVIACAPTLAGQVDWRGVAFALVAALGVAWSVTFGATTIDRADPLTVNLWANLWMLPLATLVLLLQGGFAFPAGALGWTGAMGVVAFYVVGFSCIFAAMPKLPPAQIALVLNLEPIISTFSAAIILGEAVAAQTWLGIIVMFAFLSPGAFLAAKRR